MAKRNDQEGVIVAGNHLIWAGSLLAYVAYTILLMLRGVNENVIDISKHMCRIE